MASHDYSLMRGGLFNSLVAGWNQRFPPLKLTHRSMAALLVLVAAGPLMVLSAFKGDLMPGFSPTTVPLLADFAVMSRLLVALPALVLAAPLCDDLLRQALSQFARSGMVNPGQRQAFDRVLARMKRVRDSYLPDLGCLALAIAVPLMRHTPMGMLHGISAWDHSHGGLTDAGLWFLRVSTPMFNLVALLWIWRFLLWAWVLWSFSRMNLNLRAAHPDGVGGVGFLGVIQQRFAILGFCCGVVVAGYCANQMVYQDETLQSLRYLLLGHVAVVVAVIAAPLLAMTPHLLRTKREALLLYSLLGHDAVHDFDRRWLGERRAKDNSLIDAPDASAICDFGGVFATVSSMSVVPIGRWQLFWIALTAAMPLAPLAFLAFSVDEVLSRLAQVLI